MNRLARMDRVSASWKNRRLGCRFRFFDGGLTLLSPGTELPPS